MFGAFGARSQPIADPRWLRGIFELMRLIRKQQKQAEAVFTGEFAARTRTFEGEFAYINLGLIGILPAPLTFAPYGLGIATQRHPMPRGSQSLSGFGRRSIRCERKNLFSRKRHSNADRF